MTRIIGLLSWYDEKPAMLATCLGAFAQLGASHVVCVDGAYALFPNAKAASHAEQHAAVVMACRQFGLGLTLHVPREPWAGNEVEKRNALFALGWSVAEEGDWFLIEDADMWFTRWPADLLDRLSATENDALEVEVHEGEARFPLRVGYRAQPITVGPSHCVYRGAESCLWGPDHVTALDLTAVMTMAHHHGGRAPERDAEKYEYYALRDSSGIERGPCDRCDARSTCLVAVRWRMTSIGPVANWIEACPKHARELERVSRIRLRQLGVDPDKVVIENRMGVAPVGMAAR